MKLLLDSTVLIDVLRNRAGRREFLAGLIESGHLSSTSAMNVGEIHAGLRAGEEARTSALLDGLEVYPVTASIAQRAGLLVRSQRQRGSTAKLADMIIAATALEHGLTLMTDNLKDFQIGELKLLPLP